MHDTGKNNYFFLNRDGVWPGFQRKGLELSKDGTLRLSTVPSFPGVLPITLATPPVPDGPSGLAIDTLGTLYFSDPAGDWVRRVDGCDNAVAPAPCMGGSGSQASQFQAPRGLLIPKDRNSLFVVDSGNDRIQIFDLATFQLMEIWGEAGAQPGQFSTPRTLAGDSAGNVYVVDYGNQRVQKFNMFGEVAPGFWNNMHAAGLLHQPSDVTVREFNGSIWIFVVDATTSTIFVFDQDGQPVLDSKDQPRSVSSSHLQSPMGIAAAGDALYVGDNVAQRILRFQIGDDFEFIGEAIGYQGPVAALLLDGKNSLWVNAGGGFTPPKLQTNTGYAQQGTLWSDPKHPIQVVDRKVVWHRLQALAAPLTTHARLDLFVYASDKLADAPAVAPDTDNPFAGRKWKSIDDAGNLNVPDLYIGHEARYLWLGVLFSGDGTASAALRQLRVEFDHLTYDQFLPALYRNTKNCGDFLVRLLSLFESLYTETEREIASLPALFDPEAAPGEFLAWLAGCLGLDVDSNWSEKEQRHIIAEIFRLYGLRGTAAGLRESLRLFAGVDAVIEEPLLNASWWSLPSPAESCCDSCGTGAAPSWQATENSLLGWTTMLAPAQPQGAVVGTSADLDQSHLITGRDFGSPLFSDVAYQFSVQVYRSQLMCPSTLPRLRRVLEQEKPAHTAYHLCIIEPRLRVGFQGRVGIDTVVGGPPRSLALGTDQALGQDTALAGPDASRIGMQSRLGLTTRLA